MAFTPLFRLGLTAKTVIVTSVLAFVAIVATGLTSQAFERLNRQLEEIAGTELEQLMTSVRLVQQTETLVSQGLILAQAETHDDRRRTLIELTDRMNWMRKISQQLAPLAHDDLGERVSRGQADLERNTAALNEQVAARIDGDRHPARQSRIEALAMENRRLGGELSVILGYYVAAQRNNLIEQNARLSAEVKAHQRHLLLLAVLLVISVILSGLYFETRLVRRILFLQRGLGRQTVEPGELTLPGSDELSDLANTVSSYVARIRAHEQAMQEANSELAYLAEHDPLTKLANRRHFQTAARRLLQQTNQSVCVVNCDVDHFKRINDEHGHAAGDLALVHLAGLLHACMRTGDVLARFGGEEFVLLLPVPGAQDAEDILARIRAHIRTVPLQLPSGEALRLTLSYGAAVIDELPLADPNTAQHLLEAALQQADAALYQAKNAGRDRICFAARAASPPLEETPDAP